MFKKLLLLVILSLSSTAFCIERPLFRVIAPATAFLVEMPYYQNNKNQQDIFEKNNYKRRSSQSSYPRFSPYVLCEPKNTIDYPSVEKTTRRVDESIFKKAETDQTNLQQLKEREFENAKAEWESSWWSFFSVARHKARDNLIKIGTNLDHPCAFLALEILYKSNYSNDAVNESLMEIANNLDHPDFAKAANLITPLRKKRFDEACQNWSEKKEPSDWDLSGRSFLALAKHQNLPYAFESLEYLFNSMQPKYHEKAAPLLKKIMESNSPHAEKALQLLYASTSYYNLTLSPLQKKANNGRPPHDFKAAQMLWNSHDRQFHIAGSLALQRIARNIYRSDSFNATLMLLNSSSVSYRNLGWSSLRNFCKDPWHQKSFEAAEILWNSNFTEKLMYEFSLIPLIEFFSGKIFEKKEFVQNIEASRQYFLTLVKIDHPKAFDAAAILYRYHFHDKETEGGAENKSLFVRVSKFFQSPRNSKEERLLVQSKVRSVAESLSEQKNDAISLLCISLDENDHLLGLKLSQTPSSRPSK